MISSCVRTLNQPIIKEGVKNIAGSLTCAFGLVEVYDLCQTARKPDVTSDRASPSWTQTASKVILVSAKLSLILSAAVSRPGVFILSSLTGAVFSTAQLNSVFGPNTIFAINPRHPRHVASIVAVALALPSHLQSVYRGGCWVYKQVTKKNTDEALPGTRVRIMALFNTITSRPILHLGNLAFGH